MSTQRTPFHHGLLDELVREDRFLRQLAQSLIRDPEGAEDAVQDAWLLALQRGGQGIASIPRWLSGCVRNLARQGQRHDRHRRDRESYAAREESTDSTAELVARESVREQVVKAVLDLPPTYRDTVLSLWFEGRRPKEWARELGVSVETIRTRRRRALGLLRERLDEVHGGDRSAWATLLLPLARGGTAAMKITSQLASGWVLSTQARWALGAALTLLIAGTLWYAPSLGTQGSGGIEVAGEESATEAAGAVLDSNSRAVDAPRFDPVGGGALRRSITDPAQATGESTADPSPSPLSELTLKLSWRADGSPARAVGLSLTPAFGSNRAIRAQEFRTDEAGIVRAPALAAGTYLVSLDRGDLVEEIHVPPSERIEWSLELPPGFTLAGSVVDLEGKPIPNARILLYDWNPLDRGFEVTTTDAEGRFLIRDCWGHQMVGAVGRHHGPSLRQLVYGSEGDEVPVTLVLVGDAGALAGEALGPDGDPIVGARVSLGGGGHVGSLLSDTGEHGISSGPRLARTDDRGRFRLEGVPTGRHTLRIRADSVAPVESVVEVTAGVEEFVSIQLDRGCGLEGVVRSEEGTALEGARIEVGSSGLGLFSTTTDEEGMFRLEGLPSGEVAARAWVEHGRPLEETLSMAAARVNRWEPEIPNAEGRALGGVVVNERGIPLTRWTVTLNVGVPGDRVRRSGSVETDRQGRFELTSFHRGIHGLEFSPPDTFHPVHRIAEVRAEDEMRIVIPESQLPSIRIRGHVFDPSGRPASGVQIHAWLEGFHRARVETLEPGSSEFELGPFPPGVWRIDLTASGSPQLRLAPEDLGPGEVWDCGTLELGDGGTVHVRLDGDPKWVSREPHVQIRQHGKPIWVNLEPDGSSMTSDPLSPGNYEACLEAEGMAFEATPFTIREGRREQVELSVRPGLRRVLHLDLARAEAPQLELTLSVYRNDGHRVLHQHVFTAGPPPFDHELWLAPGRYRIDATSPGGQECLLELEVAGELDPDAKVDVTLR